MPNISSRLDLEFTGPRDDPGDALEAVISEEDDDLLAWGTTGTATRLELPLNPELPSLVFRDRDPDVCRVEMEV